MALAFKKPIAPLTCVLIMHSSDIYLLKTGNKDNKQHGALNKQINELKVWST